MAPPTGRSAGVLVGPVPQDGMAHGRGVQAELMAPPSPGLEAELGHRPALVRAPPKDGDPGEGGLVVHGPICGTGRVVRPMGVGGDGGS